MIKWGQPTWMFLHTFSLKLSEQKYALLKKEVFDMIKLICASLPCPDCASHATEYMKKSPIPPTASALQKFIFDFHNAVNLRTGKQMYLPNVLAIYETVNLEKIFYICRHIMLNQPYNPRLSINKMHTQMSLREVEAWLKKQNFLL
jgi:hypothetical protein